MDLQSFEDVSTPGRAILAFTSPVSLQDVAFSQGRFELRGSAGDDLFDVSTRGGTFQILGQAGNDTLVAGLNHASISGGTGDDAITGSDAGDQLNGDGGNDLIHAGGGNDIILAQTGDDTVYGGDGNDVIAGFDLNAGTNNKPKASGDKHWYGEAGNDTFENLETLKDAKVVLSGGDGKDTLIYMGDASNMRVDSIETLKLDLHVERDFEVKGSIEASADFLNSFDRITIAPTYEADITLSSGGKFMWKKASTNVSGEIDGSKQADEIDMTNSKDYWSIDGGKGDDVIKLGAHGELFGGDGNDTLIAGTKGSAMMGGRGRDILVGGIGSDEMTGSGSDTFVFKANGGHDTIYSFDKDGKSADKIDLSAIKGITSYNDLIAHHVHQDAHGVSIALGAGDQIYIYNVAVHDLHASTFIL